MKKVLLLLSIISLVSCVNSTKKDTTDTESTPEEEVVANIVDNNPSANAENTEITLDFSSYHLYTCEADKYDASGYQPVSAKVTIDEGSNKASMKLYDSGEDRWYTFNFRLDEKLFLQEGVVTYTAYNNNNQKCYIYVSTNRPGGLFVDINSFVFEGNTYCCWMQEGSSEGSQYRGSVTSQNTPNTYPSNPSYSPNLNGGSSSSGERIYYSNYPNYEETDDCVEGVVVYEGDDDYYIVETRRGYTILERYSGSLYEGNKVRGELNRYGHKYLINRSRDSEVKVYIEDFALSDDDAVKWMGDNDHLK